MTRFELGSVHVDLSQRSVTAVGGSPLPLSWRGFDALRVLIEARGDVVGRAKLLELLWPDVTVDDSNLSQLITHLRRDLGPHADWIETIPKRGYRLKAPPLPLPAAAAATPSLADAPVQPLSSAATLSRRSGRRLWPWVAAMASAALLAGAAYQLQRYRLQEQAVQIGRQAR